MHTKAPGRIRSQLYFQYMSKFEPGANFWRRSWFIIMYNNINNNNTNIPHNRDWDNWDNKADLMVSDYTTVTTLWASLRQDQTNKQGAISIMQWFIGFPHAFKQYTL